MPSAARETRKTPSPVPISPPETSRSPSGVGATLRTWSSSLVVAPVSGSTTFRACSGEGASRVVAFRSAWTRRSPRKATWGCSPAGKTFLSAVPRVWTTTVDLLVAGSYSCHAIRVSVAAIEVNHAEASGAA
ncbi:hypothetical protein GCM10010363_01940 [Streptomyces omiyaensis]|nr:hypothetical protein GCM10010363_01940 [Streptomyces omiyaensis]